jgi:hypothetical protein
MISRMLRTQRSTSWVTAGVAALALTAVTAFVAMSARAPLSRSTPINAASAQAPISALVLLLLAAGAVMLGGLIVLLWSGHRRKDDELRREPTLPDVPWYWKFVATLLPFLLGGILVAAVLTGGHRRRFAPVLPQGLGGLSGGHIAGSSTRTGFVTPGWLPWAALAVVLVAIAAVIAFLLARRASREPLPAPPGAGAAVQAALDALDALDANADARAAVIAAYAAMERTLAEHGTARAPTEAPREFLHRVLLTGRATESEARTLTNLFEEARFSTHPVPERVRGLAVSALRSLRTRLELGTAQ